jgi:[ribosomal protein S5]-alanine N-acetyltransferase
VGLLTGLLTSRSETRLLGKCTLLRAPRQDDFLQWRDLRQNSRSFLEAWEPRWNDDEFLQSSFRRRISHYNKLVAEDLAYPFFIFSADGQTLQGAITLSNVRRGVAQMATLGYWTGEAYANRGVMADALATIKNFASEDLDLHRLEAACLQTNTPSIRLLVRAGFEREGFAKAYLKINGRWEDHILWGYELSKQPPTER